MRIHENPTRETMILKAGQELKGIEGALSATAEVDLGDVRASDLYFSVEGIEGEAFLMRVERLDARGEVVDVAWQPLHSLHWGGAGLPRACSVISPRRIEAWRARRLRITLCMLAQGNVCFGPARLWTHGNEDDCIEISKWKIEVHYRNAYTTPRNVKARVIRSDSAMKAVRFAGVLPDLRYQMDVTLRAGSEVLEYGLKLHFPTPTRLGLRTPPFSEEDGSLLGAECERPYVPGVAVLMPLPRAAEYYSDKPYYIRKAFVPAEHSWHTDCQNWWLGMSTFIGMNLAVADYKAAQLGLLTRGVKHFFRWRRAGRECLGLSFGASMIHQMTQGHSAPPDSPFHHLIKRTSHNPYFETPFLRAHGDYVFHYAICPATRGKAARRNLWKRAQEFALPARAVPSDAAPGIAAQGVECKPDSVVLTAVEPRGDGLALRALNMSDRPTTARIRLPIPVRLGGQLDDVEGATMKNGWLRVPLPPWALREIVLERG